MTLSIEITRDKTTRVLSVRVVQTTPNGKHRGRDLLAGRKLTRIESAETAAKDFFRGCGVGLAFDVQASPDVEPTYRLGADRAAVRREVES